MVGMILEDAIGWHEHVRACSLPCASVLTLCCEDQQKKNITLEAMFAPFQLSTL